MTTAVTLCDIDSAKDMSWVCRMDLQLNVRRAWGLWRE